MPDRDRRRLLSALAAAPFVTWPLRGRAQQAGLITGNVCLVQPETTEGPFYLDEDLVRRDITGGRDGAPTRLRLQVVREDCAPVPGARVDVWHCDAGGIYSGVRSAVADARGAVFLRGTQMTGADGVAAFATIFPGWYPGRTPHIHYKVWLDDRTVLTSQLFFPDRPTRQVYAAHPAYAGRGPIDTPNARDFIARRAGEAAVAALGGSTGGLDVALVVGIG